MKVLFVSAEVSPFAKVGGLADVAGSLPKAIKQAGHDIKECLWIQLLGFLNGRKAIDSRQLNVHQNQLEQGSLHQAQHFGAGIGMVDGDILRPDFFQIIFQRDMNQRLVINNQKIHYRLPPREF